MAAWLLSYTLSVPLLVADDQKPAPNSSTPAVSAAPQAGKDTAAVGTGPVAANYLLGPDDEIVISALHVTEITDKPYRIDSAGYITVPMIGRLHAGGLTVELLERELSSRLAMYVREPEVSVRIAEFKSQPISVLGAVKTPGIYHLRGRITLMEVLSAAGGLDTEAGSTAHITRQNECGAAPPKGTPKDTAAQGSALDIQLKPLMEAKDTGNNVTVCANDVIVIPRAKLVYVLGEVRKPGGFVLHDKENVSILEALSMSEGMTHTAGPKNARILRTQAGQSQRTEIPVNLNDVLNGKAEDIKLRADDILLVPDSKPKTAAARGAEAAIQMLTGVIIWRR
jgi:polysaccharide export outer membrane protein